MQSNFDVIVIGSGHNGLVCGAYLAKAGLKTLVLERRDIVGGAAVTEEFAPGIPRLALLLRDEPAASAGHPRSGARSCFGLEVLPANDLFCPLGGDDYIVFSDDLKKTQAEFARFSRHDAEIYPEFARHLEESANAGAEAAVRDAGGSGAAQLEEFQADRGACCGVIGRIGDQAYRLVDLLTQSAYDYLSVWFENDIIKALLAYYASIGTFAGPKSPGTAYVIMHHLMGEHQGAGGWGFIRGGMGAITASIARSGRASACRC